jgi:hypothetical protein
MGEFFGEGAMSALRSLGMMADDVVMAGMRYRNKHQDQAHGGVPFPDKSPSIGAERFSQAIRGMDENEERPGFRSPDNANYSAHNSLDRLTTWGNSMGIDENRGASGFMAPANPRG